MDAASLASILWVVLIVIMILYFGTLVYRLWFPSGAAIVIKR